MIMKKILNLLVSLWAAPVKLDLLTPSSRGMPEGVIPKCLPSGDCGCDVCLKIRQAGLNKSGQLGAWPSHYRSSCGCEDCAALRSVPLYIPEGLDIDGERKEDLAMRGQLFRLPQYPAPFTPENPGLIWSGACLNTEGIKLAKGATCVHVH